MVGSGVHLDEFILSPRRNGASSESKSHETRGFSVGTVGHNGSGSLGRLIDKVNNTAAPLLSHIVIRRQLKTLTSVRNPQHRVIFFSWLWGQLELVYFVLWRP